MNRPEDAADPKSERLARRREAANATDPGPMRDLARMALQEVSRLSAVAHDAIEIGGVMTTNEPLPVPPTGIEACSCGRAFCGGAALAGSIDATAQALMPDTVELARRLATIYTWAATAYAAHGRRDEALPVGAGWIAVAAEALAAPMLTRLVRQRDEAIWTEREACAEIAIDAAEDPSYWPEVSRFRARTIAAAIRARK